MHLKLKAKALAELELRKRSAEKLLSFDNFLKKTKSEYSWDLPHLAYMRSYLERIADGEQLKVMFFLPPQHGKSTQNTVNFSAYYMLKNAEKDVILGAYNSDFACDFSCEIRDIVKQHKRLSLERADRWRTQYGGGFRAGGVGSGITGFPADLVVIDDPIKSHDEAHSKVYRDKVWKWWISVIVARMHVKTSCIFTMTRWHQDDLAGRLLERDEGWEVVKIPALAEEDDVLKRKVGEALWVDKFPRDFLLEKQKLDAASFESMYQQNPTSAEGSIIKRAEMHYYKKKAERYDYILQSWDTAFKKGEENDFSAMTTWGCIANKVYLLDAYHDKLEYPELKTAVVQSAAKWKPNVIVVENKGSGQSIVQDLRRTLNNPLHLFNPRGDKTVRCHAITDKIRAGLVLFPESADWICDYINELCSFPSGKHDDWLDSTTQALIYLNQRTFGSCNNYEQIQKKVQFV